ncbi:short-chain fatty acid transporter [Colwellia sp. MB02u-10]|jgi:short-chain fatty acids transporter|nr:short-chain fatty acid transporter [Colwellia sp. MB02u-10]MBA6340929.1 short-chain fatty acid transporter [Colwellia sp. MB02u-10]
MKNIFVKFTDSSVSLVKNWLPDPFVFAVILTFVVFIAAIPLTQSSPMDLVTAWYGGFWSILSFAMQMAMVLVTGTILATTDVFKKYLSKLAGFSKTPGQAILLVSFVALVASFINWGFGLVIGAIFAREVAHKVKGVHYPLLIASAYVGFLIWHAGFSGSIPLTIASSTGLAEITNGALTQAIPTSETIFSSYNLIIVAILVLTLPFILKFMHPSKEKTIEVDTRLFEAEIVETLDKNNMTPAQKLENSKWINRALGVLGYSFIFSYFIENGFALNLNIINFIFLFTAIILHGTPIKVVRAVADASKNVGGILLQFPFYAGIMGLMKFMGPDGVSLAGYISQGFVNISTVDTFPLFTFLSAGVVNFFVPSGGGQWVVQAPIMMPAAIELGVDTARTAMAIAWGDAWTNMIQPFWALPLLGIAKLGARDIMGYCLVILVYSGIVISLGLVFL